ncbi:MAG: hypothetical protein WA742_18155 [Candidatus Cybelea sp.]
MQRQIAAKDFERSQRREIRGEILGNELVDMFWFFKVTQGMQTEIVQRSSRRQPIARRFCGGCRNENLIAVADRY